MPEPSPPEEAHGPSASERTEERRRYAMGALAGSYAPDGVADMLRRSREYGRRKRAELSPRERRVARIGLVLVLALAVAIVLAIFWLLVQYDG